MFPPTKMRSSMDLGNKRSEFKPVLLRIKSAVLGKCPIFSIKNTGNNTYPAELC